MVSKAADKSSKVRAVTLRNCSDQSSLLKQFSKHLENKFNLTMEDIHITQKGVEKLC